MKRLKVLSVFGTRPEAIKMAPLVVALSNCAEIDAKVCVTAQHRQMLDQVLEIFRLQPDYDLDVMKDRQTVSSITTGILEGMGDVLAEATPDLLLVHGDTTTTFSAALAAFYAQIPVGHVEAGLRTYDKHAPFPEEMNRILTGHLADIHFAPTDRNRDNLNREGIVDHIYTTGNTVIDALGYTVKENYEFRSESLREVAFDDHPVVLITAHRRENLGKPLENICRAVLRLSEANPEAEFLYPVHLNPAVRETVFDYLGNREKIRLIDPVDVDDMHNTMSRCRLVMTDSGGLQEEAPSLGVPVVVLRGETERPEAVTAGTVVVAGTEEDDIVRIVDELLNDADTYERMAKAVNPYGDGKASERILQAILHYFGRGEAPTPFSGT